MNTLKIGLMIVLSIAEQELVAANEANPLVLPQAFESQPDQGFNNTPPVDSDLSTKYKPINFAFPSELKKVEDLRTHPVPSKVGFYDGDMKAYSTSIQKQYPDRSCIKRYTQYNIENEEDVSQYQRCQHFIQDAVMQGIISKKFYDGNIADLEFKKIEAVKLKDTWQSILCLGLNRLGRKSIPEPTISPELLQEKTAAVRAQIYVDLKRNNQLSNFYGLRGSECNKFEEVVNSGSKEGISIDVLEALEKNYKELKTKVKLNWQIDQANKEKRLYQTGVATALVTVVGLGYWYTHKK